MKRIQRVPLFTTLKQGKHEVQVQFVLLRVNRMKKEFLESTIFQKLLYFSTTLILLSFINFPGF